MTGSLLTRFGLLAAAAVLAGGAATAAELRKPVNKALPGVEPTHRIVKPLPPEPEDAAPAGPRTFKIGNVEVEVRGKVSVEFGFGPRRYRDRDR